MDLVLTASPLPDPVPVQAWPVLGPRTGSAADGGSVDVDGAISAAVAAGAREIALVGGEVLLQAELPARIQAARAAGVGRLWVWTDGRVLARPGAAAKVRQLGIAGVGVILWGAEAGAHDYVAGRKGRFSAALKGLKAARTAGLRIGVVAPILRPTYRDMGLLVQRSLAIGVGRFDFVAMPGPDRPLHGLLPHLEMAAPHVERAMAMAAAGGRKARTWHVPHCLLAAKHRPTGPGALWWGSRRLGQAPAARDNVSHFERKRAGACASCALWSSCAGPLANYVDQHGESGLVGQQP